MAAFMIWMIIGIAFVIMGIYDVLSRKMVAFGFWANVEPEDVTDIKRYNRAAGMLWCVFGIVFILLGFPLLEGQNSPFVIISILGTMFEAILAMIFYTLVIERKYRKKEGQKCLRNGKKSYADH